MKKALLRLSGAVLVAWLTVAALLAQTTGSIRGTVQTGGTPLPGVTVEAKSSESSGRADGVTDADGHFNLTLLPPGDYAITVTLPGLRERKSDARARPRREHDGQLRARRDQDGRSDGHGPGEPGRDRLELDRPEHDVQGLRGPARPAATTPPSSQLDARRRHRRVGHAQHVDHGVRLDGARELLLRRRLQHDRRRVRKPGQDAQLRVHPGSRVQVRRLRGRVRALDGRHRQRRDEVGRQRVPRRRLRLLQRPSRSRPRTSTSSNRRRTASISDSPRTTTARTSEASS